MRYCSAIPVLLLTLAPALRAAETVALQYGFEERDGAIVRDTGPLHADGRLNAAPDTPVLDAYFENTQWDRWYPILRDGLQIKAIREGSDSANTGGDVPIVAKRGEDYEIDYARGRAKTSAAGRIDAGTVPTLELRYVNPGPTRCAGHKGRALRFDGLDDAVTCGEPIGMDRLSRLEIDLWFQRGADGGSEPWLLSKGRLAFGFDAEGRVFLKHRGLTTADGRPAKVTQSDGPTPADGRWHHLTASYDGARVSIALDGKGVATTADLTGLIDADGPLRFSGPVDPHFFAGKLDEVTIRFDGPNVPAPDAR